MPLALIAAVAANGVIGDANRLPWRLPEDLRRFRALTRGHAVIMLEEGEYFGRQDFNTRAVDMQRKLYMNASCVDDTPGRIDSSFVERLLAQ
jgi:hypothetical protein